VDRIRVNLKLSPKLYRQIQKAAKAEGLTGSAFVELSIAEGLERLRQHKSTGKT
jgi:uncharacterized protein (DUF1778 family)